MIKKFKILICKDDLNLIKYNRIFNQKVKAVMSPYLLIKNFWFIWYEDGYRDFYTSLIAGYFLQS